MPGRHTKEEEKPDQIESRTHPKEEEDAHTLPKEMEGSTSASSVVCASGVNLTCQTPYR